MLYNETTIEDDGSRFDMGFRKNIESVFGANPYLWLIPVYGEFLPLSDTNIVLACFALIPRWRKNPTPRTITEFISRDPCLIFSDRGRPIRG